MEGATRVPKMRVSRVRARCAHVFDDQGPRLMFSGLVQDLGEVKSIDLSSEGPGSASPPRWPGRSASAIRSPSTAAA